MPPWLGVSVLWANTDWLLIVSVACVQRLDFFVGCMPGSLKGPVGTAWWRLPSSTPHSAFTVETTPASCWWAGSPVEQNTGAMSPAMFWGICLIFGSPTSSASPNGYAQAVPASPFLPCVSCPARPARPVQHVPAQGDRVHPWGLRGRLLQECRILTIDSWSLIIWL